MQRAEQCKAQPEQVAQHGTETLSLSPGYRVFSMCSTRSQYRTVFSKDSKSLGEKAICSSGFTHRLTCSQ